MIKLRKEDNIYILYLENKPVNALSMEFVYELLELIDEISKDDNLRGLILMSTLKHFSAGADLKERSLMSKEESINAVYLIKSLIVKILNFPSPTLSLINGACLGGGLELACGCDFRLCSKDAAAC
jgi:enoyl-CoA hydratase/carnithine racemase